MTAPDEPATGKGGRQTQSSNVELIGQIGGTTNAVAIQGSYAYVGVGPRLVILNIANPARPIVVGQTVPLPGICVNFTYVDRLKG